MALNYREIIADNLSKAGSIMLVMVALMGQAPAQETFKQRDQVCTYVQAALPWLIYGYTEIISDPLVVDGRCPPWLRYGGSVTIRTALQPADLQVSPDSQ